MEPDVLSISARARTAVVRDLTAWDRHLSLPVTSRRKHVIGTLQRAALRPAAGATPLAEQSSAPGLPAALADAFVGFVAGFVQLTRQDPLPGSDDQGSGGQLR